MDNPNEPYSVRGNIYIIYIQIAVLAAENALKYHIF